MDRNGKRDEGRRGRAGGDRVLKIYEQILEIHFFPRMYSGYLGEGGSQFGPSSLTLLIAMEM